MKLEWPLLLVEWEDPCTLDVKWTSIDEMDCKKRVLCVSVGFLLKETRHAIILLPHISGLEKRRHDRVGWGSISIPVGCIIRRKVLVSSSSAKS